MNRTLAALFAGYTIYSLLPIYATDKKIYQQTAKLECKNELLSKELCLKAHGTHNTCADAIYDLDVCVLSNN